VKEESTEKQGSSGQEESSQGRKLKRKRNAEGDCEGAARSSSADTLSLASDRFLRDFSVIPDKQVQRLMGKSAVDKGKEAADYGPTKTKRTKSSGPSSSGDASTVDCGKPSAADALMSLVADAGKSGAESEKHVSNEGEDIVEGGGDADAVSLTEGSSSHGEGQLMSFLHQQGDQMRQVLGNVLDEQQPAGDEG
jgi:hypothetical protein